MSQSTRSASRAAGRAPTRDLGVASIARQVARLAPAHRAELEAYLRASGQRCWVCNRPEADPVRLQRREDRRWALVGTVELCSSCLTALCTPALVRRLGIARWVPEPGPAAARSELPDEATSPTPAATTGSDEPPLELIKGA